MSNPIRVWDGLSCYACGTRSLSKKAPLDTPEISDPGPSAPAAEGPTEEEVEKVASLIYGFLPYRYVWFKIARAVLAHVEEMRAKKGGA